jgi:hypothetical protein
MTFTRCAAEYLMYQPFTGTWLADPSRLATDACLGAVMAAGRQRLHDLVAAGSGPDREASPPESVRAWERLVQAECGRRPGLTDALRPIVRLLQTAEQFAEGQRRAEDWEDLLGQVRPVLGPDHPATLRLADQVAGEWEREGDHVRALALGEHTFGARKRVLGADHRDTLISANNLGLLLLHAGSADRAIELLEPTVLATGRAVGPEDPHTMLCATNLADAYAATGDHALADRWYAGVYAEASRTLGADHELTRTLRGRLR